MASLATVFRGELIGRVPENREDGRLCSPPLCHYKTFTLLPGEEQELKTRLWHPVSMAPSFQECCGWKLAGSALGSLRSPHQSPRESLSCSQSVNGTSSQLPRNLTLPGAAHNSGTPVPGHLVPSSGLQWHCTHMTHIHRCWQKNI